MAEKMEFRIKFALILASMNFAFCTEIIRKNSANSASGKMPPIGLNILTTPVPKNFTVNIFDNSTKNGANILNETANTLDLINSLGGGNATAIEAKNEMANNLELGGQGKVPKVEKAPLAKALPVEKENEEKNRMEEGIESAEEEGELERNGQKEEEKMGDLNGEDGQNGEQINQIQPPKVPKDAEMHEFLSSSEESHAFRYFICLFLFTIVLYIVAHNRKKIIGCILEGQSGRRNGSTARYRRLSQNVGEDKDRRPSGGIDGGGGGGNDGEKA